MHTLIADIGSTKANWTLLNKDNHLDYSTKGFNPNYQSEQEINHVLEQVKHHFNLSSLKTCYLYGAGIDGNQSKLILETCCKSIFGNHNNVFVENDLLAAARSSFSNNEEGVIAILGTGSNVREYKFGQLIGESNSLGYILGDEGGGVSFGKYIVKGIVYNEIPNTIINEIKELQLSRQQIIEQVYSNQYPQIFLANFARVCFPYKDNSYIKSILNKNFNDFIVSHLLNIEDITKKDIKFVGSMAYFFQEELIEAANNHKLNITQIVQNPQEGLVNYHKQNL